ncbi:arylsulfatase [Bryocella elongata]|uniref:Arylsulfatase n=1 Tax=Bryocella elongata TaxID=863522 RepID=A0A1H6CAS0_9BACT|nr:arylsulfatase [Bryocella elongata]SEG70070.1 arylsulfatase [Bryocella elongata]
MSHCRRAKRATYQLLPALCSVASSVLFAPVHAQEPDRTVLPVTPPAFRGKIAPGIAEAVPGRPWQVRAPQGAPNVLLVLIDDAGYGQCGTFGGLIPTPTLDALAANGLRYNRFHVAALCSPTRAALLTGRNNHAVGMGTITNLATDFPGYNASIPKSAALLPQVLQMNGYATAAFGKWHLIPEAEAKVSGPFDHWPTHQGFDRFYGFLNGETDQWYPELTDGTKPVEMVAPQGRKADYTLNEDLADHAIQWIKEEKSLAPDKPFFVYFAPGATHEPLQAPKAYIERFRGKFDMGWDRYREIVFEQQKKLGVIPADAKLTPRPKEIPAWDSLTPEQKKVEARLMEVFAGFMAQADHEIGRVITAIHDTGQMDNTMIVFIAGDNGASLEGGVQGTSNAMASINGVGPTAAEMLKEIDELGGPHTTPHYPVGWAWAGNTPFQWGKRIGSHLGGTRDPMVVTWPAGINDHGGLRTQFEDVTDVAPTILDAAHIPVPTEVNGVKQQRMDGRSMLATFASASAPGLRTTQYFEMLGNRAIYHDGWMAASRSGSLPWVYSSEPPADPNKLPWELYHLSEDYSEADNVAAEHPEKVTELAKVFDEQARENNVYPIDPRFGGRQPRPEGHHFTYYTGTGHLYLSLTPAYENHSHTITAYVDIPKGGANGVLMADGGEGGGFSLFLKDGKPSYTYNYFKRKITTVSAQDALPPGPAKITLRFVEASKSVGGPADVVLEVNDKRVASAHLPDTVRVAFSFEETFDVGEDSASAVGPYESPFPFTGTIDHIDLDVEP